jgi:PGF-CTERM protein
VDAATGQEEWAFTQPSDDVESSPTVVDGTVYVGSLDETLYAVDAATGEQEWAFTQPSGWVWSSPTVYEGTVYVGSFDETLYAVDAATGEQEWAFTLPFYVLSSPTVVADPESGDSVGSRVMLGTLGHHGDWRYAGQNIDVVSDGGDASGGGSGTNESSGDEDGSGPGFGVGGAFAGLGGAGYLLKRRLEDENSE